MREKVLLYIRRAIAMLPAVPMCAVGVALFVKAGQGADPLTSFEIGLALLLKIKLGYASLLFEGIVFFVFLFVNRKLLNFGSAAFCFGIGPCINYFNTILETYLPGEIGLTGIVLCLLFGTILIVLGIAYYVPMNFGLQSLDLISVTIAEKTHRSYGFGLTITFIALFTVSLFMGADFGIGTAISVFSFGGLINLLMKLIKPFSLHIAGINEKENLKTEVEKS